MKEMALTGTAKKVAEVLRGSGGMLIKNLAVETGFREGTLRQALARHPETFERGYIGWQLTPGARGLLENDGGGELSFGGRMGGVVPVEERKGILSVIARWPLPSETQVTPRMIVEAIDLLNRMDGIYKDGLVVNLDNRQINIYVSDKETKALLERVGERTQRIGAGGSGDEIAGRENGDKSQIKELK